MKNPGLKAFMLVVGIIIVVMLNAGCEEEQLSNGKKARFVAAENLQLKKQLQQHDSEMEKLKEQHIEELKKQKELLAKCQEEKKALQDQTELLAKHQEEKKAEQEQFAGEIGNQLNNIVENLGEENKKLREENENLKLQIEKLKMELEEIKKPTEQPDRPL